ncbi:NAD(P)-dependent alcohol dehydrogenase [Sulfidibacter corallicola]|uniref:NAD(P)-dependent alcohol dehydrogenase n=1 Tax=Sulfidibacter corallicola TaxID=2818388 RepID=A0A8A4TQN3_SULCO|nr:NAD(P)-dependent alcohol dehydrogenase [Sulfidibacter corallicola]QTD51494.1 NAD(P)-dependent alcohol dehydrogenase [Sulfidibacter corallicola]
MIQVAAFDTFGLEHLRLQDRPQASLGPQDVRVRIHAASLNYRDLLMIQGLYNPRLGLPLIPCSDGAGEVLEVGSEVEDLNVGDRVCSTMIPDWEEGEPGSMLLNTTLGGPVDGMLARERVLPRQAWLKLPDYLDYDQAATLPVAGLTAWTALVTEGGIERGSRVLLLGTGGVSIMALQIAKALGAEVIITSSSDEKLARAKEMGADHTINYRTHPKWEKEVLALAPGGVDLVVEVGGDGTFDRSVKSARVGGRIALIGVLAAQNTPVNLTSVIMKKIRVQGILVGSRADFKAYLAFLAEHRLEPVIDRVFEGLDQASSAFEVMAAGRHFGKIVVRI